MDPTPDPPRGRCSVVSARLGEPTAGTATTAASWLCVEQPGPWGREALTHSHLDTGLGRELAERAAESGTRVVLIRRPGSHPDRHRPVPRSVYVAHTAPTRSWLEAATVTDPSELLELDFAAVGRGQPPGLGRRVPGPLLLVCTNGRRDVCCALVGRPVADRLAARHGTAVWECTHLGGHRFAPTGLLLPSGYSYGRLDVELGDRLLSEPAVVPVAGCRGRSTWPPAGQVAELAVRELTGEGGADALTVTGLDGDLVGVAHVDGREWSVRVTERVLATRPASCGARPKPALVLRAGVPVRTGPVR